MGVTSFNLLLMVLATCSVVLSICFGAMFMLNKDIDASER